MRTPSGTAKRTKQICVSLTPELFEKFQKISAMNQATYSTKAYQLIEQYVTEHQYQLDKYDTFMNMLQTHQPIKVQQRS